jgi:hypothetical protein
MTTASKRVAHRARMVAKPCDMDAIVITGINSSPPGASISAP